MKKRKFGIWKILALVLCVFTLSGCTAAIRTVQDKCAVMISYEDYDEGETFGHYGENSQSAKIDEYAKAHENKLGKTEAWVILHAEEGASLLYGIREGVTIDDLRRALTGGEDVEPLIQRIPVKAGDVFYMPAGMVHAIGGGILLYEIQQSSDVTYRLWDFNRVNDKGEKRPLHIRQSLDVIRPELKGQRAHMPEHPAQEITRLLDVPAFTLDCVAADGACILPAADTFRVLTALEPLTLRWLEGEMELNPGDTVLLPAACPEVGLEGHGRALVSGVGRNA